MKIRFCVALVALCACGPIDIAAGGGAPAGPTQDAGNVCENHEGLECWSPPFNGGVCMGGTCVCRNANDCDDHGAVPCLGKTCVSGVCGGVPIHEGGMCQANGVDGVCVNGDCKP